MIAWTVTHEEVIREPRQYCQRERTEARSALRCKLFYLLTCEYCFSHSVAAGMLLVSGYELVYQDWRGEPSHFSPSSGVAKQYMNIYNRLRLDIKHEQVEIKADEKNVDRINAAEGKLIVARLLEGINRRKRDVWFKPKPARRVSHVSGKG